MRKSIQQFVSILLVAFYSQPLAFAQSVNFAGAIPDASSAELKNIIPDANMSNFDHLVKSTLEVQHDLFSVKFLERNRDFFEQESEYLGGGSASKNLSYAMYQQWLYFEVYKAYRLEFLMMSFVKALILTPNLSADQALKRFDSALRPRYFTNYRLLADKRQIMRQQVGTHFKADTAKQQAAVEFIRGSVESAYLVLAMLDQKVTYLEDRYEKEDDMYIKEVEKIAGWRQILLNSSPLLATQTFKNEVTPYYVDEVGQSYDMQEQIINAFLERFMTYVESKRSISNLVEYFAGDQLLNLGKDLGAALQVASQTKFRKRIEAAVPPAVAEVLSNVERTLSKFEKKFIAFDIKSAIVTSNTRPKNDNSDFHKWLEDVFKEQVLHWIVSEDYPHLQKGVEVLTGFVNDELKRQSRQRMIYFSSMAGILSIIPAFKHGGTYKWLGNGLNIIRNGLVLGGGVLAGTLFLDAYGQYVNWRNMQRLSRLNVEGMGLTSLIQEEKAFQSLMLHSLQAGISVGLFAVSLKSNGRLKQETKEPGWWMNIVRKTWQGEATLTVTQVKETILKEIGGLRQAFAARNPKQLLVSSQAINRSLMGIFTQFMVMFPAALPQSLKGVMNSIPVRVYDGIILGAVMGIMSVTMQHYINAMSIQLFVESFKKMGLKPPTYWEVNALNKEFITKRDAFVRIKDDLILSKNEITKMVGLMTMWQHLLSKELDDDTRINLEIAVAGGNESVSNMLMRVLVDWYQRPEYRDIFNSLLKEFGYGIIAVPSIDDPVRMTIVLKIGTKYFAYQSTAQQLETMKNRKVLPDAVSVSEKIDLLN